MIRPAVHTTRVFLLPDLTHQFHTLVSLRLIRGMVDRFKVGGKGFLVLVGHILERIAHDMNNAAPDIQSGDMPLI